MSNSIMTDELKDQLRRERNLRKKKNSLVGRLTKRRRRIKASLKYNMKAV